MRIKLSHRQRSQPGHDRPTLGRNWDRRVVILCGMFCLPLSQAWAAPRRTPVSGASMPSTAAVGAVRQPATLTGPSAEPTVVNPGKSTNILISITGQLSGAGIVKPTGSISYVIGSGAAQLAIINNGMAAMATPLALGPGTYNISVNYAGDTNYSAAISIVVRLKVRWVTPALKFAPPASIVYGTTLLGELTASASYNSSPVAGAFTYTAASSGEPQPP